MNKAVFIDKDGTLIHDIPYNVNPSLISLQEGALDGLQLLKANGFLLVVITNQAGIAHGYFQEKALEAVQEKIRQLLKPRGVHLSGFYYCPHHPLGKSREYAIECDCRKPGTGMILEAADHLDIDLSRSWMIGDILHDIEAGNKAGCHTILINNGNETEWIMNEYRKPHYMADNIRQAADFILNVLP
ncbi:MAG: HAD family hydrolase [Chitinophagaceae bacterium]